MGVREAVKKFMTDEKWLFEESAELGALRAGYQGKSGRYVCYARWNEKNDLFTFYAVPQLGIPKDRYQEVMEFITRANFGLPVGNFELDLDDGELRFKASVDAEGSSFDAPLVRQTAFHALTTLDRYMPGLEQVVNSKSTPKDAVARVEK